MSFVVTVYVREGIVMATESRSTLTYTRNAHRTPPQNVSVTSSDSARKLFLTPNGVGISTYGAAAVNGAPIAFVVESFISDQSREQTLPPRETAEALLTYFRHLGISQATVFHVAGYREAGNTLSQEVFSVELASGVVTSLNLTVLQGANWGGECDAFQCLLNDVALVSPHGEVIPFEYFTLQKAIDFATLAIRTTIDNMCSPALEKNIGGQIDAVVITPDASKWISRKQLSAPNLCR
jgi:hypothetical protein